MEPVPSSYRPEIDGLRCLAVLAVIANHFNHQFMASGFLGVDIFFVISGYVITGSLHQSSHISLKIFLRDFYAKRSKRLLPVLILFVLLTSAIIALFNPKPDATLKTGVASLFGVANLYLLRQATDYFGNTAALNPFTHTWSLGVEEQFYIIFPLVMWFAKYRTERYGRSRAVSVLVFSAIASWLLYVILVYNYQQAAFYLMPARLWELALGALTFLFIDGNKSNSIVKTLTSRWSPTATLAVIIVVLFSDSISLAVTTTVVAVLTALLIASLRQGTTAFRVLTTAPAMFVGRISYSLYLWHWAVICISKWTIGISIWTVPAQLFLMFLLATLSYRYVELPGRGTKWIGMPSLPIALGLFGSLAAAALVMILALPLRGELYLGNPPIMKSTGVETLLDSYTPKTISTTWHGPPCVLSGNSEVGKIISVDKCTLGNMETAGKRILVIGNSFSAAFVPAFGTIADSENYAFIVTSSWGASVVREIPNSGPWNKASDYYWQKVVPTLLGNLKNGDVLLLVNDMHDFSPPAATAESQEQLRHLESGLSAMHEKLQKQGISIAVVHGLPFARDAACEPESAIDQWFSPAGSPCKFISRQDTLARRKPLDMVLSRLVAEKKITLIDLLDIFCPAEVCNYKAANGEILYRDVYSHPSVEAAQLSASTIRDALRLQ